LNLDYVIFLRGDLSMVQTPLKVTLEEFLKLSDTKPASEYIDGHIIQKPMPQGEHSAIQGELVAALNLALKSKKIARAFPELRCTFGSRSVVPDVAVFTWDRIPRQENGRVANVFSTAPDWTIEILSPDQSQMKVTKNILHCLKYQTQMGWLIDPDDQSVLVYLSDRKPEFFETPQARLPVPKFAEDFSITVGDLFEWLLE
jgi:Uma2 family endonuclease